MLFRRVSLRGRTTPSYFLMTVHTSGMSIKARSHSSAMQGLSNCAKGCISSCLTHAAFTVQVKGSLLQDWAIAEYFHWVVQWNLVVAYATSTVVPIVC